MSPPKSMPERKGARFARRRWMGADIDGGSKEEGELAHPKRYPGWEADIVRRGHRRGHGRARFLTKRSHMYQAREVHEPEAEKKKTRKKRAVER